MKKPCYSKTRLRRLMSIILMSAWVGMLPQPASCGDREAGAVKTQASSGGESVEKKGTESKKAPGMKIYIDPKTGDLSNSPAQPPVAELQRSLEVSKESTSELRQVPSPRPGGGIMIDLKGRFRHPLTATRKADGKVTIEHRSLSTSGENE